MSKLIFIFLFLLNFSSFASDGLIESGFLTKRFRLNELPDDLVIENTIYEINDDLELFNKSYIVKNSINKMEFRNLRTTKAALRLYHGIVSGDFVSSQYQLKYKLYQHESREPKPLIFVFPPIMGNTYIDKTVARKLVNKGANVVLIEMESLFEEEVSIGDLSNKFYYTLYLLNQLVESMATNEDLNTDNNRVGIFGLSLGGIVGATLAGISPLVKRLYVLGAGGNLPIISLKSKRKSISIFKENSMLNNNLTEDENWLDFSKGYFRKLDPLNYIENFEGKKVFMLMSPTDTTVPFKAQAQLWNALGKPEYRLYDMSHISMIIRWFIEDRRHMTRFFID